MKPKTRIHEWAADNFKFVQYPHIRAIPRQVAEPQKLDIATRVIIGVFSFACLLASIALISAGLFIFYVMIFA